jgi:hypothetical protein
VPQIQTRSPAAVVVHSSLYPPSYPSDQTVKVPVSPEVVTEEEGDWMSVFSSSEGSSDEEEAQNILWEDADFWNIE